MAKRQGKRTILFDRPPVILGQAAVVGKREGEGPLGDLFDEVHDDNLIEEGSWEKAESKLQKLAVSTALKKANLRADDIDTIFAGDLLNQCIGSSFGLRELGIPFVGLYGACSTMALSLGCASQFIDSGAAKYAVAVTSSHFCAAERQYRFPLEYGGQRPPTAQWTVTGSGAIVLSDAGKGPRVTSLTIGEIEDLGIKDANNMGAAMAPAAATTIRHYLSDTHTNPDDYDAIFTGDLGEVGTTLLYELLERDGVDLSRNHEDCGLLIYDREVQDVHAGGSGCGCSASVLCAYILKKLREGEAKKVLFCATGALLSPTSTQQGESIPSIAHLVCIEAPKN